ncbi:MAG TPA: glycosyl transferase family 2 [Firmicutes bacterium]|nr:glycosyl transferase family 2 [Bacillota bacterium]
MKTIMIIPAYNEEESISKTVSTLKKIAPEVDYIVINDGSTDNTMKICQKEGINVVDLPNNLGIGGAVQTGYKYAALHDYDIAIQYDGDGQHDPKYIALLIQEIENGANMAIGSRYIGNESTFKSTFMRRLGKNILSSLIHITTGTKIYDPTSGYRAANRQIIDIFKDKYPIDYPEPDTIVAILKKGYKVKEIPVSMNERQGGKSSISPIKSAYYMIKVSLSILLTAINTKKER